MHHYGRHGPRAWLKWRRRHTLRHSSVPVPLKRPVIFHLKIPAEAERVLVVLDYPENERPETTVMEFPSRQLPEPEKDEDNFVKRDAINLAGNLNKEMAKSSRNIVDKVLLNELINKNARMCLRWVSMQMPSANSEQERLSDLYQSTCLAHISFDGYLVIEDEKERELLEFAKHDCKNPPPDRLDGRVSYHKEHGAVIRALEVLGLVDRGIYEQLEKAHDLADKYHSFCLLGEGMVIWPDDATFRGGW